MNTLLSALNFLLGHARDVSPQHVETIDQLVVELAKLAYEHEEEKPVVPSEPVA